MRVFFCLEPLNYDPDVYTHLSNAFLEKELLQYDGAVRPILIFLSVQFLPCSLCGLELGVSVTAVYSCQDLLNRPLSESLPNITETSEYIESRVTIHTMTFFPTQVFEVVAVLRFFFGEVKINK